MPPKEQGKGRKVTATVGDTDYVVIARICAARGVTISQLIQEWISDSLYKVVASGYLEKIEKAADRKDEPSSMDE